MSAAGPPSTPKALVLGLDRISGRDVAFASVKGASLGELAFAGLPVPPGFVVGTPVFARLLESGDLGRT